MIVLLIAESFETITIWYLSGMQDRYCDIRFRPLFPTDTLREKVIAKKKFVEFIFAIYDLNRKNFFRKIFQN